MDIYAQRIDHLGQIQWQPDGVPVCVAPEAQVIPAMVSDGSGGTIVSWTDYRLGRGNIFAQKITSEGSPAWNSDGVAICTLSTGQSFPELTGDGSGGSIIVWSDFRGGSENDLYAQRIDSNGTILWDVNGVPICSAPGDQGEPVITPDGVGGAIIGWADFRSPTEGGIFVQRIDSSGTVVWTTNGIPLATNLGNWSSPEIIPDANGGAYVTWSDYRNGTDLDIYVQRVNHVGNTYWTAGGLGVQTGSSSQTHPQLIIDGAGGVLISAITLADPLSSTKNHIYAQWLRYNGTVAWGSVGIPLCTATVGWRNLFIVGDDSGGAIVTWEDSRNNTRDIYSQKFDTSGAVIWNTNGQPVSIAPDDQHRPVIVSDGIGGIISVWSDDRAISNSDIYAQNIDRHGYPGFPAPTISSLIDNPSDQGGLVKITWDRSYLDDTASQIVTSYTVWRNTPAWSPIDTIATSSLGSYEYIGATSGDSGGSILPYNAFFIRANSSDSNIFWDSSIDSIYSVDNTPPLKVESLTVSISIDSLALLSWKSNSLDPDIADYMIYRSYSAEFIPDHANLLATSADSDYVDTTYLPGTQAYYRVSARDIHSNVGSASSVGSASMIVTRTISVNQKWNLISVPMVVPDYSKTVLFPTATSDAFHYDSSYSTDSILVVGRGYWLKFASSQTVDITGYLMATDTIDVVAGWNLIGTVGIPINVSSVIQVPSNIIQSNFFSYDGKYIVKSYLEPAMGYWVKIGSSGMIILSPGNGLSSAR